jgi:hypothetical protein
MDDEALEEVDRGDGFGHLRPRMLENMQENLIAAQRAAGITDVWTLVDPRILPNRDTLFQLLRAEFDKLPTPERVTLPIYWDWNDYRPAFAGPALVDVTILETNMNTKHESEFFL